MHYFPISNNNLNNNTTAAAELTDQVASYTLDTALLDQCDQVTSVYATGTAVQSIYYTRAGPGPLDVTDVCNLDPDTGLNTYHPTTTTTTTTTTAQP
jgi:hypothetical protein